MYSFAQRPGWSVVDEPFYAAYLARTGADHPGRDEVLASQPVQSEEVWRRLQALSGPTYIKNMAHHMDGLDLAPAAAWKHVLWIRSPRKVIASFAKVVPDVQLRDVALQEQLDALAQLQALGSRLAVVDSDQMLAKCFVNFFKHCARDRAGFGEYFAHANGLAALPRKYKCAHGYSCRSVIVQNRLWCSVECCKPERHNPVIGVMSNIRAAQIVDTCSCAPALGDFLCIFAKGAIIFGYITDAAKP
jgi:hypothetical protein